MSGSCCSALWAWLNRFRLKQIMCKAPLRSDTDKHVRYCSTYPFLFYSFTKQTHCNPYLDWFVVYLFKVYSTEMHNVLCPEAEVHSNVR